MPARRPAARFAVTAPPPLPAEAKNPVANKHRKEVEISLDGITLACRPTLAKIAEIEARFGPAISLLRKLSAGDVGVADLTALVSVMVKGVGGAPPPKDVPEMVFQAGAFSFAPALAEFIGNAIATDEPPPEGQAGN
jgi:hypothetical protein